MTAPALSPAAALVRRFDPDLFHAALFAPEPVRARLMLLYALDIELSRAAAQASEPLIPRMRLQWWRDVLAEIAEGAPPRQHEVAGPLHAMLTETPLPSDALAALVEARERELDGPMDKARFDEWIDGRFGALTRLAAHLLTGGDGAALRAAGAVGRAMGIGFALRQAVPLAMQANLFLLPGLGPEDRAALARGRTTDAIRAAARGLAGQGQGLLASARSGCRALPRAAVPALLPVWRAEKVLAAARRPDLDLKRDLVDREIGGRGLALAWRALTGRW